MHSLVYLVVCSIVCKDKGTAIIGKIFASSDPYYPIIIGKIHSSAVFPFQMIILACAEDFYLIYKYLYGGFLLALL